MSQFTFGGEHGLHLNNLPGVVTRGRAFRTDERSALAGGAVDVGPGEKLRQALNRNLGGMLYHDAIFTPEGSIQSLVFRHPTTGKKFRLAIVAKEAP